MYLKYLACIPFEYNSKDDNTLKKQKAYENQLKRLKGKISDKEYNYYEKLFESWYIKIKEKGINLDGVTL